MEDIAASAFKKNLELFRLASVGGQPSHRETYSHSSFTAWQSNYYSSSNPFGTPPPNDLPCHWRTSIFDGYQEDSDPYTPVPQPTFNRGQPDTLESDNFENETDTPTHTSNQHN